MRRPSCQFHRNFLRPMWAGNWRLDRPMSLNTGSRIHELRWCFRYLGISAWLEASATGTAIASRAKETEKRRQRWQRVWTHIGGVSSYFYSSYFWTLMFGGSADFQFFFQPLNHTYDMVRRLAVRGPVWGSHGPSTGLLVWTASLSGLFVYLFVCLFSSYVHVTCPRVGHAGVKIRWVSRPPVCEKDSATTFSWLHPCPYPSIQSMSLSLGRPLSLIPSSNVCGVCP